MRSLFIKMTYITIACINIVMTVLIRLKSSQHKTNIFSFKSMKMKNKYKRKKLLKKLNVPMLMMNL